MKINGQQYDRKAEVPRENGRIVLAHGEVTGHAHAITASEAMLFETDAAAQALGTRILDALAPVDLEHEEHETIHLPEGEWGVRIQRQYEAGAFRRVED